MAFHAEPDPSLLSINTATVRAQWKLPDTIAGLARHGIRGIWSPHAIFCTTAA